MSLFFGTKSIKPKDFIYPKEFIDFRSQSGFDKFSPLWIDLFSDVVKFIDMYDFLLREFPRKKYIPFAYAVDHSGLFNNGYIIVSSFSPSDKGIFIYDVNNEFSSFQNRGDFSHIVYKFDDWVKFASNSFQEFRKLHLNSIDE